VSLGILDPNGEKCVLYCNSKNQLFTQTEARFLALTGVAEKGSFPVLLTIRYAYRFVKVLPVSEKENMKTIKVDVREGNSFVLNVGGEEVEIVFASVTDDQSNRSEQSNPFDNLSAVNA
jgi:hypothetical protein